MKNKKEIEKQNSSEKGIEYELFVKKLQTAILNSEEQCNQKNINVEQNKKIVDNNGIERQFDLYWEYELGGMIYKTVVECKDYNSRITIDKIDSLIGKVSDILDINKKIFATKQGYQSGAETKAKNNGIELLIAREPKNTDWQDKYGNFFIKEILIDMKIQLPAKIINFNPVLDGNWLKNNTNIDILQSMPKVESLNKEIIIENLETQEKYSLFDLQSKLLSTQNSFGTFRKIEKFNNSFIYQNGNKFKLLSYEMEYIISPPISNPIHIDFSQEMLGVIEYLNLQRKKTIWKNGKVTNNN